MSECQTFLFGTPAPAYSQAWGLSPENSSITSGYFGIHFLFSPKPMLCVVCLSFANFTTVKRLYQCSLILVIQIQTQSCSLQTGLTSDFLSVTLTLFEYFAG